MQNTFHFIHFSFNGKAICAATSDKLVLIFQARHERNLLAAIKYLLITQFILKIQFVVYF